ncbi:MAG: Gfo/Idh/MocA family oxidoreductase [Pseudomonadota bacterium]
MKQVTIGIIGVGWVGGIRANALGDHPQTRALHVCDIRPDRLAEVARQTKAAGAVDDYRRLLDNPEIEMIYVCTTPESTHFPITRDALLAGKHVMVEKPLAQTTAEADELIAIARARGLKLSVGYSQRFNPRFAYVRKAIQEGMIGDPVTCLVSRNVTRELGSKVTGRTKLSPAAMEATHDIDFLMWCLAPRKPIRVFSQASGKFMKRTSETLDHQWVMITMDDGTTVNVGAGWILPLGYPNYSHTWIEIIGTEGSLTVDDSHKEVALNTVAHGIRYPLSSMPGEAVDHVYAGPMSAETLHFLDAVARDRGVLVKAEEARAVMDIYNAADTSAERHEAVALPRNA